METRTAARSKFAESFKVGRFTVIRTPLVGACCNKYDVYAGNKYLSSQCSIPNKMQCETLAIEGATVKRRTAPATLRRRGGGMLI